MKDKKTKILIIALIAIVVVAAVIFAVKIMNSKETEVNGQAESQEEVKEEVKKIKIVDEESKTRPYAVMINNNHAAWPQCGLKDAYLVYEIIAEGGITRMMALYKDQTTAKIGSIRSARHYFIEYAEENDAIFVHWGGSPQAYNILNASVDNIDGIALEGSVFFRDSSLKRDYEHTGFTNMGKVVEYAKKQGFTRDAKKDLLLNYSADEIDMAGLEGAEKANTVDIKYSNYHTTSYEYDEANKVYKRSMSGKANVDLETGEQYTAKNIIIYKINNYSLDDYGRQELDNVGNGTGYFVSGGYVIPINWEKTSKSAQTVYKYKNGEELVVNDGNTFIQICPTNSDITIEE